MNCVGGNAVCTELHIHKFPTFVVFKHGGGYEIHHGKWAFEFILKKTSKIGLKTGAFLTR